MEWKKSFSVQSTTVTKHRRRPVNEPIFTAELLGSVYVSSAVGGSTASVIHTITI
jgi:hypothetical protein